MCGLAGYIGEKKLSHVQINNCHNSMQSRGPDSFGSAHFKVKKKNVSLLHNRLKIIDLSNSANQPFSNLGYTLIFNGEIYNFKEIKKNLISKGYKFKTNSDTEVLLKNYIHKGHDAFNDFEGMWAIAIWDDNKKELILSRDRFGQKPLFYLNYNNQFFFGSQINQIKSICSHSFNINEEKIWDYLFSGYRVVFKNDRTFYKKIKHFPPSHYAIIKNDKIFFKRYWTLKKKINNKISYLDAKSKTAELIKHSVKNCLIADQNISSMLSGGIDSNVIHRCIKDLKHTDITFCSIIDNDDKYNEKENIDIALKNDISRKLIVRETDLLNEEFLGNLQKKINFYSSPYLTINSYVSSLMYKKISENNIRVNLSGGGSDEIFTGYYQHHAYYLKYLNDKKNKNDYNLNYKFWKEKIYPVVRNPFLKDKRIFLKEKNLTNSLLNYCVNPKIMDFSKKKYSFNFKEKRYSENLLKNRMYNEIFFENVPTFLYEDDRNHMFYSIENRSPYLDKNLVEFAMSLPLNFLIKNGTAKYILRDAFKGKISNKILFDSPKRGFNFNILRYLKIKKNYDELMELFESKSNPIYEFLKYNDVKKMLKSKKMLNSENKFIFSVINLSLFLKNK